MISNGEGREHKAKSERGEAKSEERRRWHYLAVKKFSALLRTITFKNNGDFYCLNCLDSFRTKNKLESHKIAIVSSFRSGNM